MEYVLTNRSERMIKLNYRTHDAAGRLTQGSVKLVPGKRLSVSQEVFEEIEKVPLFVRFEEEDLIVVRKIETEKVKVKVDATDGAIKLAKANDIDLEDLYKGTRLEKKDVQEHMDNFLD